MIVLTLIAALVGPLFVDWTTYRADFEREASRVLGRNVTVEGDATARLLPFPSVSFGDVTVSGGPAGQPAMHVDTFSMDLELAPFLRGEVLIFDMRLERPVVTVELDEEGRLDWFDGEDASLPARQVILENITVEDGELRLLHRLSGREHRLSNLDARLSAQTLSGPWRLDGTADIDGLQTALSLSTGTYAQGAVRVRLRVAPFGSSFFIETDGVAQISNGNTGYSGQFRAELMRNEPESPPVTANPVHRLTGLFELDHGSLDIPEFTYQAGPPEDPYIASGRGGLDLGLEPRFFVAADGAQVRLGEEGDAGAASLESRLAAIEQFLVSLPRPGIPGTIEINLPALVAGDTTIRDLQLSAEPGPSAWTINQMRALLPGRSTIEASGDLAMDGGLSFEGELLVAVNQPSGFATWLARDVDDAIRRLPPGGFSARVALSRERQSFEDLELALGGGTFRGEIDSATPEGIRPSLRLALDGGRLDLPAMQAFASLFVDETGIARLSDRDVDIALKAGPVELDGVRAATLDTALRLREGAIEVDRLSVGDLSGANISATASLSGWNESPAGHVDASVIAVDLAPLVSELARRFPTNTVFTELAARAADYPGLLEDAQINLVANAMQDDGASFNADGTFGGTTFQSTLAAPHTSRPIIDLPIELNMSLRNDEPAALYALAGLPGLPLGFVGAAEMGIRLSGELSRGAETALSLRADGLDAVFNGALRLDHDGHALSGMAALTTDDLSGWLATAGVSLPGMTSGLPLDLRTALDVQDRLIVLSNLEGLALDRTVSGDLNVEMREGRPHISGALNLPQLDIAWLAALVLGEAGTTDGSQAFAATGSDLFSADLSLNAAQAAIGPRTLTALTTDLRYGPEGLALNELGARWAGGRVEGFVELANNAGTGLFSAQLAVSDASLDLALDQPALDGGFDLSAVVSANGRTLNSMMSALSGSLSVELPQLVITGLDEDAFGDLIAEADRIGRDIDEERTAQFAPAIIGQGAFVAQVGEVALSLAGGQLRAPPIHLDGAGADLTANLRADLGQGNVSIDALLSYDAGDEELIGSTPSVRILVEGPPASPAVRFDPQPLAQFLTQRALEIEQARVEAMQASLLESQRLRRENRYYAAREEARLERIEAERRAEAEAFLRAESARVAREALEEERQRLEMEEQEAQRAAEEAARRAEEEEDASQSDQLWLDVERFLREDATPASNPPEAAPNPAADVFRPENLTIEGLLGGDGLPPALP